MSKLMQAVVPVSIAMGILGTMLLKVDAGNFYRSVPANEQASTAKQPAPDKSLRATTRHANRTHYVTCRFEKQERWSKRRKDYVMRNVKVCT